MGSTRGLLGPACASGHCRAAAAVAFLDYVSLETQRAHDTVKLEKEAAGIAERMTFRIATPQWGGLCKAIRASRRSAASVTTGRWAAGARRHG